MAECQEHHTRIERDPNTGKNITVVIPHEYIAGICILTKSVGTVAYLEATYPYSGPTINYPASIVKRWQVMRQPQSHAQEQHASLA